MKIIALLITLTASITLSIAQQISYDIATLTLPTGWTKNETNSMMSFTTTNNVNQTYCVIGVYKSIASKGNIQADANSDWNDLVKSQYQLKSTMTVNQLPEKTGWRSFVQSSSFLQEGKLAQVILVTYSNTKVALSVLGLLNDKTYLPTFEKFCKDIEFSVPGEVKQQNQQIVSEDIGSPSSFGDYQFQVPTGWNTERTNEQIILRAPDQYSALTIMPMMQSSGDLDKDMDAIFPQVFQGWQLDERNPDHHIFTKGIAPAGWEYFKKEVGLRSADNRDLEIIGFLFLARLNKSVAVIAGTYVNWNDRLSENNSTDWIQFFHSLGFKNFHSNENSLAKELLGNWLVGSSTGLSTYTFAANGHYSNGGAFSTSNQISDYTVKETTTSFVGDGTYSLKGSQLILTSSKGITRTNTIRVFYQSQFGQYFKTLGMLEKSTVDGSLYEVTFRSQEK